MWLSQRAFRKFDAFEAFGELVSENALGAALEGDPVATAGDDWPAGGATAEGGGDVSGGVGAHAADGSGHAGEDDAEYIDLLAAGAGVDDALNAHMEEASA